MYAWPHILCICLCVLHTRPQGGAGPWEREESQAGGTSQGGVVWGGFLGIMWYWVVWGCIWGGIRGGMGGIQGGMGAYLGWFKVVWVGMGHICVQMRNM